MQKDFIYENYLKMPDDLEFEQAMKVYEELLEEAAAQNISVDENFPFHGNLKGLYVDQNIALSDQLETSAEKACILAEELGHHYTSVGNILDISDPANAKQERQARMWTYDRSAWFDRCLSARMPGISRNC